MLARWVKFSVVGGMGLAIQLAALWALARAGLPVALATALAVETAVLHNFAWHEGWTWRSLQHPSQRWSRLWRFHAATGAISIAANVGLTLLFKAWMPLLVANLAAVAATAILNFVVAEFWVFRSRQAALGS